MNIQSKNLSQYIKIFITLLLSTFFVYSSQDFSIAQTAPDCKSFYPEFRDLEELNKQPGTLTQDQFKQKIFQIADQFSKLTYNQSTCQKAKELINQFGDHQKWYHDAEVQLKEQQSNAEVAMASAINLKDKGVAKAGDFVSLYCFAASKRALAIYELQQNWIYFKIAEFTTDQFKQLCSK